MCRTAPWLEAEIIQWWKVEKLSVASSNHNSRSLQCVLFNWDAAKGAPCTTSGDQERGLITLSVMTLIFDKGIRRWRMTGGDIVPLPVGWLASSTTLQTPFIRLANMSSRVAYRRAVASFSKCIQQRTAAYCWVQQAIC